MREHPSRLKLIMMHKFSFTIRWSWSSKSRVRTDTWAYENLQRWSFVINSSPWHNDNEFFRLNANRLSNKSFCVGLTDLGSGSGSFRVCSWELRSLKIIYFTFFILCIPYKVSRERLICHRLTLQFTMFQVFTTIFYLSSRCSFLWVNNLSHHRYSLSFLDYWLVLRVFSFWYWNREKSRRK